MPVGSYWPLPLVPLPAEIGAPLLSPDDFLGGLRGLLPPGRAWPRDDDTVLTQLLRGLASAISAVHAREAHLLVDAFPATAEELLPEWETSVGLPDPCAGEDPLVSDRQKHVVARLTNGGGQSVPFFIAYALSLGFVITITEFVPLRCGHVCGTPCYGTAWAFAWQVNAPQFQIHHFQAGHDVSGDPLATWGSTVLQCELSRFRPGHTVLFFSYH